MNVLGFIEHLGRKSRRISRRMWAASRVAGMALRDWNAPGIRHLETQDHFTRRFGDFTANICGEFSYAVVDAWYQVNGNEKKKLGWCEPRVPRPNFVTEMTAMELSHGTNELVIAGRLWTGRRFLRKVEFEYDASRVELPGTIDWNNADYDVQDGFWEVVTRNSNDVLRLVDGHENYDRIVALTGSFPVDRDVYVEMIFKRVASDRMPFGFGVLPLWGGRPDNRPEGPREGWNFGLSWYYSKYEGVGMEFSYRSGLANPAWVSTYKNWNLRVEEVQKTRVQTRHIETPGGGGPIIRQKMKWWAGADDEPNTWMELSDSQGAELPDGEFSVALIAHNCNVEFKTVSITKPLETTSLIPARQLETKLA